MTDAITKLCPGALTQPTCQSLANLALALIWKPPPKRLSHHCDSSPLQFERSSQTGSSLGSLFSGSIHRAETITRSQIHPANTKHRDQESPKCSSDGC
jgi:hypothetical protein